MSRSAWRRLLSLLAIASALSPAGCSAPRAPARTATLWLAGHPLPAFDPDGPPDALRQALEHQLSRGLLEVDSAGRVTPALADSLGCSRDSLTWTFRLRAGARFTDGTRVTSAEIRDAMIAGLGREDHATREWLLAAVKGVAGLRAGRARSRRVPGPPLGIETAGDSRLVVRLAVREPRLLEKLAVPGVTTPWKRRTGGWSDAVGVGPYRVQRVEGERILTLVATRPAGAPGGVRAAADTLRVRFLGGATRVRNILRRSGADVLWPLPPGFLDAGLPEGWELAEAPARPERRLLLIFRPDVPPLGKLEAREALARATRPVELALALGGLGEPLRRWLPGASEPFPWPAPESAAERAAQEAAEQTRREHARRDLARRDAGRRSPVSDRLESYHVVVAFDDDQSGASLAAPLQGQWARAGHYAELRALHGEAALEQPLRAAGAQATLVESQAPLPGLVPELAMLVQPLRGPVRGAFRTGWRTREFDRWLLPPGAPEALDPDTVQQRIASERIVFPLASLPWRMAFRAGALRPRIDPRLGPDWTLPAEGSADVRTR